MSKTCPICSYSFEVPGGKGQSRRCYCGSKECMREANHRNQKANRKRDPEYYRSYYAKKSYGLSEEQLATLYEESGGRCMICSKVEGTRKHHIDHCHKTGKVRGLLCPSCNKGLGHFEDNIETMEKAIDYLKKGV